MNFPGSYDCNNKLTDGGIFFPGQSIIYKVGGISFKMKYVPGGLYFPTDAQANSFRDDTTATVKNSYWIATTTVTYRLWSVVFAWAVYHGYVFANPGNRGGYTDDRWNTLKTFDNGHDTDPVTVINWCDAVVWCNALTEYYYEKTGIDLG